MVSGIFLTKLCGAFLVVLVTLGCCHAVCTPTLRAYTFDVDVNNYIDCRDNPDQSENQDNPCNCPPGTRVSVVCEAKDLVNDVVIRNNVQFVIHQNEDKTFVQAQEDLFPSRLNTRLDTNETDYFTIYYTQTKDLGSQTFTCQCSQDKTSTLTINAIQDMIINPREIKVIANTPEQSEHNYKWPTHNLNLITGNVLDIIPDWMNLTVSVTEVTSTVSDGFVPRIYGGWKDENNTITETCILKVTFNNSAAEIKYDGIKCKNESDLSPGRWIYTNMLVVMEKGPDKIKLLNILSLPFLPTGELVIIVAAGYWVLIVIAFIIVLTIMITIVPIGFKMFDQKFRDALEALEYSFRTAFLPLMICILLLAVILLLVAVIFRSVEINDSNTALIIILVCSLLLLAFAIGVCIVYYKKMKPHCSPKRFQEEESVKNSEVQSPSSKHTDGLNGNHLGALNGAAGKDLKKPNRPLPESKTTSSNEEKKEKEPDKDPGKDLIATPDTAECGNVRKNRLPPLDVSHDNRAYEGDYYGRAGSIASQGDVTPKIESSD